MRLGIEAMHLIHIAFMLSGGGYKLVFLEERNSLLEYRMARKIGLPNGAASNAEFCHFCIWILKVKPLILQFRFLAAQLKVMVSIECCVIP